MGSEGIAPFRLSVWHPAQFGRRLDYALTDEDMAKAVLVFDRARLQEEIYFWQPGQEDVWGCIQDPSLSSELRALFVEGFAPSCSPEKRSMDKFREAVDKLGTALASDTASTWADTIQMVRAGCNEATNLRSNCALSLLHHMEWILRTFGNLPAASVTIR